MLVISSTFFKKSKSTFTKWKAYRQGAYSEIAEDKPYEYDNVSIFWLYINKNMFWVFIPQFLLICQFYFRHVSF